MTFPFGVDPAQREPEPGTLLGQDQADHDAAVESLTEVMRGATHDELVTAGEQARSLLAERACQPAIEAADAAPELAPAPAIIETPAQ